MCFSGEGQLSSESGPLAPGFIGGPGFGDQWLVSVDCLTIAMETSRAEF